MGMRIPRVKYGKVAGNLLKEAAQMAIETTMLTIHRVPELVINSGTDWVALGGTLLTALAVVVGAVVTNKNFKHTVQSQERMSLKNSEDLMFQSKAEALSKNRQEWINSLRTSVSSFIASATELYSVNIILRTPTGIIPDTEDREIQAATLHREIISKHAATKGEARRYLALIELHLNLKEDESIKMVKIAKDLYQSADNEGNIFLLCDELVEISQSILKKEWERVKQMI
jgi:hypothetical protein